MAGDIVSQPITVVTSDGLTLHGDAAAADDPIATALICHPHPRMGGDRHNGVVEALYRALPRAGVAVVRIDFRGVGRSEGDYGGGVDERIDAEAGLTAAHDLAPDRPLWAVGYSFGGDVALSTDHPALTGWVSVAAPLSVITGTPPAATDDRPATLLVPAHDQFLSPSDATNAIRSWNRAFVVEIEMADHFLIGRLDAVVEAVLTCITQGGR